MIQSMRINENKGKTKLEIRTTDNKLIKLQFIHEFLNKTLCYMDKNAHFESRVRDDDGIFVPTNFKMLEYALLNSFLNDQGITEEQFDFLDTSDYLFFLILRSVAEQVFEGNIGILFCGLGRSAITFVCWVLYTMFNLLLQYMFVICRPHPPFEHLFTCWDLLRGFTTFSIHVWQRRFG